ncbi:MAG: transposase family protein, partial [Pigeon pea little leaf phytoplasma]|nr:transposase family protein [Pigeon pea little leaf phytoplasma]
MEHQTGCKIMALQSDNGREFTSKAFTNFLTQNGILHRLSCPYTHQQQGIIEGKHRHITETGLSLLATTAMPLHFWDSTFTTAVYLINRMPTPILQMQTPFEILFHKKPDYSVLRVFGCACYPYLRPYNKHKFDY